LAPSPRIGDVQIAKVTFLLSYQDPDTKEERSLVATNSDSPDHRLDSLAVEQLSLEHMPVRDVPAIPPPSDCPTLARLMED
jgi:hypothetical protein